MARSAYQDGYLFGKNWIGPNGNGSFGNHSHQFLTEYASRWDDYYNDWWDGFWAGYATQRRAA